MVFNLDSSSVFFVSRLMRNAQNLVLLEKLTQDHHDHNLSNEEFKTTGRLTMKMNSITPRNMHLCDEISC